MSQRYRPPRSRLRSRPPRRRSCAGCLVPLVLLVLVVAGVYLLVLRPQVGEFVGQQLGERLVGGENAVENQIGEQVGAALPGAIAALPSGEIVVSTEQANAYIAANPDALGPLDGATVQFLPDRVAADIQAFGTSSRASAGLAAQDGQIVLRDPQIEGPLGTLLSATTLADALEEQINTELMAQGRTVRTVRIDQGQVVLEIE